MGDPTGNFDVTVATTATNAQATGQAGGAIPPVPPGVGRVAVRSAAWMVGQTLASKLATTIGQVVLAWLLVPEEFGSVGLAFTAWSLAMLLQQGGIQQILMQRFDRFRLWATPAFWLSLTAGTLSGLLLAAAAPALAWAYRAPETTGLMLVLALTGPLGALSFVPNAQLQAEMRFRGVALVNLWGNSATVALNILFAWLGFGAYSFVWPRPIAAIAQAAALWALAKPRIEMRPRIWRWRYLMADSGLLTGVAICSTLMSQGAYIVLGLTHDRTVVGIFFFAFAMSAQIVSLLAGNVASTLMAAMRLMIDDPVRLKSAFLRASRALALLGAPLCFMQAAAAEPLFRLLFEAEWMPAVPVFQILSLGMGIQLMGISAGGVFQAQGRNRELFVSHAIYAAAFLVMVSVGAKAAAAVGVAVAVAAHAAIISPVNLYWAMYPLRGSWRDLKNIVAMPLLAAGAGASVGYILSELVGANLDLPIRIRCCIQIVVVVVAMLAVFIPAVACFAPETLMQLVVRARELRGAGRRPTDAAIKP